MPDEKHYLDISPTLNPARFDVLTTNDHNARAMAATKEYVETSYAFCAKLNQALDSLEMTGGTRKQALSGAAVAMVSAVGTAVVQTGASDALELLDAAEKSYDAMLKRLSAREAESYRYRNDIEKQIEHLIDNPPRKLAFEERVEIRSYLRSLSEGERMALIQRWINEGDAPILHALYGSRGEIYGVKDAAMIRQMIKAKLAPDHVAALEAVDRAREAIPVALKEMEVRLDRLRMRVQESRTTLATRAFKEMA